MNEDARAREPEEEHPEVIDQTVTVEGSQNTTVVAGRDAHVVVGPPSALARAELVRYLAPFLLPVLLLLTFGQQLGLPGRIAIAVATTAWMAWSTARDTYLRLVQRIALPVIAVAYTTSLTVSTAIPAIPTPLQIAVPAILWITAAVITLRLIESESRPRAAQQYMGVALIGAGVALINLAATVILGGYTLPGFAGIAVAAAGIGLGAALILDAETLFGAAMIGLGLAGIGAGAALILDAEILFGAAMIGLGLAGIGLGAVLILDAEILFGPAAISYGLAGIGLGAAMILDAEILFGVAMIGIGFATSGFGVAIILDAQTLGWIAMIGGGIAASGFGTAMILDAEILFGVAMIGGGLAASGFGVALIADGRSS
ncbi:hypothetical protein [Nocardia beijingensis]|uniref:Uncharacterized protein n=1 Tax=Nocardia beijingensis TaxID=95162 RepID=A0ABW7WA92_9NOCA